MKEGNEVTTPRKKTQTDTPRLPRAERERLIVEGAVQFFAEVGFGGDTRELAKRLNITHPLLFRYFASKNALIERVYQEVFIGRRSEEHTSELQSLMRISYAVFSLKKKYSQILSHNNADNKFNRCFLHSSTTTRE